MGQAPLAIEPGALKGQRVVERYRLRGLKRFEETELGLPPGPPLSLAEHPLQSFQWGDYTAKPDVRYRYRVVPVRGKPKRLEHDDRAAVTVEIGTEPEQAGAHAVYFNRGVAASQAYARKIPDPRPDPDNPGSPQMRWLSRGLYEALTEFIGQARGSRYGLRGAFYEFRYLPVAQALKRAARAGADVKILYDAVTYGRENRETIGACGITRHCRAREGSRGEKHNKFLVLLRDGKPVSVWTGSTNLSVGGIFGHSNVGHVVRDRRIAEEYLAYWNTLWEHPDIASAELRRINSARTPTPVRSAPANSTLALFSPRDLPPLDWYAHDGCRPPAGVLHRGVHHPP